MQNNPLPDEKERKSNSNTFHIFFQCPALLPLAALRAAKNLTKKQVQSRNACSPRSANADLAACPGRTPDSRDRECRLNIW